MFESMMAQTGLGMELPLANIFTDIKNVMLVILGFSLVVFVHELGHFLAAKWCDVRVERFAIGFGREIFGFQRGETRYSFNWLPLGGYVKMLGQEDFEVDKSGEMKVKDDPRAFTNKPVGQRMIVVSAGVVMNLILAAILFMVAFMIGMDTIESRVGLIMPDSVADQAGLRIGDLITDVNGEKIKEFMDIPPAVMLSQPGEEMKITVERPDPAGGAPETKVITVVPQWDEGSGRFQIGIMPAMDNTIAAIKKDPFLPEGDLPLLPRDRVIDINGAPTSSLWEIKRAIILGQGQYVPVTIERPAEEGSDDSVQTIETRRRAYLQLRPSTPKQGGDGHLCGFVPRCAVLDVREDSPAMAAGFKPGDVIAKWANQTAPKLNEILTHIKEHKSVDIPVVVERRNGQGGYDPISLTVRPQGRKLFGVGKPEVGLELYATDEFNLVVADIEPDVIEGLKTPASVLAETMPRGSKITALNSEPIKDWRALLGKFLELAGTDIQLSWTTPDGAEVSGSIFVPKAIGTAGLMDLPLDHIITRIGGHRFGQVDGEFVSVASWRGAMAAMKAQLEEAGTDSVTVEIVHRGWLETEVHTEQVEVTAGMLDPWPLRAAYDSDIVVTDVVKTTLRETNPIAALSRGGLKTWYFIKQVYMMVRRMVVTQTVPLENVSGPVGIVQIGSQLAGSSTAMLVYFLAIISANLAVLNFMPLPIVDGGVFVFLLIEKIKGSPVSLKIQMATQLIGLAMIVTVFIYVTFHDISRLL